MTVPARLGEHVGHWKTTRATGLKSAGVAWTDGTRAVYAMPWANPRPGAMIDNVTLASRERERPEVLLLGLTAGTGR